MDKRATKTSTRYGEMYVVTADTFVGRSLIEYGEWTESELSIIGQVIKPGMVVADIGANVGSHTLALAKLVGPSGRVVALEPQPFMFRLLSANLLINGCNNVVGINAGAGASPGWLNVPDFSYRKPGNYGAVPLQDRAGGLDSVDTSSPVPLLRLDDIPAARDLRFLKIDVEGMEAAVIEGAKGLIGRNRPLLYVENEIPGEGSEELIGLLMGLDYTCYWDIAPYFRRDNFKGNTRNVLGNGVCINMMCVPSERPTNITNFKQVADPKEHPRPPSFGRAG